MPLSLPEPPAQAQASAPLPFKHNPVPLIPMTLDCRNATNNSTLRGEPIRTQEWCEKPDVNAVCENGQVVVKGLDMASVCKSLCRCTT